MYNAEVYVRDIVALGCDGGYNQAAKEIEVVR